VEQAPGILARLYLSTRKCVGGSIHTKFFNIQELSAMDIERLKIFLDAAQTLNFSKTAKRLHVAQPTVSKTIKDIERTLNVELFVRSTTGLKLTEAGQAILPWALRLVQVNNQMIDHVKSLDGELVGRLRIACTTSAGKYILPHLVARFRVIHPNIQVSILACTQEIALDRVLEKDADLGVISSETWNPELQTQYFFTDQIILIVPADHPWANREYIEPADLIEQSLIMRESTSGTRRALISKLASHDIMENDLNILMEVGNAEAIVSTVGAGLGVSFVSRMAAIYALAIECVVEVPVVGLDLSREINIARRTIPNPNRAQDVFWSFIHDPENEDIYRMHTMF
jgi:DNA-binding transcriptional LysR family regulator